ncbi:hypothetical protein BJV77DRAFT_363879 [Russula vinacea]|nr:hypothetical protein BJV77DRAFT_363879 [Russula vinacea]
MRRSRYPIWASPSQRIRSRRVGRRLATRLRSTRRSPLFRPTRSTCPSTRCAGRITELLVSEEDTMMVGKDLFRTVVPNPASVVTKNGLYFYTRVAIDS